MSDPKVGQGELKAWIRRKTNRNWEKSEKDKIANLLTGQGVFLSHSAGKFCHVYFFHLNERYIYQLWMEISKLKVREISGISDGEGRWVLYKSSSWGQKIGRQCQRSTSVGRRTFCSSIQRGMLAKKKKRCLWCDWPGTGSRGKEKASGVSQADRHAGGQQVTQHLYQEYWNWKWRQ